MLCIVTMRIVLRAVTVVSVMPCLFRYQVIGGQQSHLFFFAGRFRFQLCFRCGDDDEQEDERQVVQHVLHFHQNKTNRGSECGMLSESGVVTVRSKGVCAEGRT